MSLIYDLKESLNIPDDQIEEVKQYIYSVEKQLNKKGIVFPGHLKIGFYSHMVSFYIRVTENQKLMDISKEIASELDDDVLEMAEEIVAPIFQVAKIPINQSEVILIAIHIQNARNERGKADE